ncbi:MAG: alkaline phosphatase family protein [Candidatus Hydrogenedentes bacterium]|nr:alkaline phosphatase family protein [Candidatus Hydrogenedentota bacterium]
MHNTSYRRYFALTFLFSCIFNALAADAPKAIVIVLDGLRPDYVTPALMPNVHALGQRGVVCANHHSVFPTVTRVNSSTFSTGCYPARHGIMGNTIYVPAVDKEKGFSTGDAANLMKLNEVTGGKVLTAPTLGEILESAGMKLFVASSGSSGSSYLLNPHVKGGGIVNTEMVLPESAKPHVDELLGPVPEEAIPNAPANRRIIDGLLRIGVDEHHAELIFLWVTDPDHTAHPKGIGSPETTAALKHVDEEVGRLLSSLKAKGLDDETNIFITSDHGFSTQTGKNSIPQVLVQKGVKKSLASTDVIVSEGAIYVDNHDPKKIQAIVEALQTTDWIGAVFTKAAAAGDVNGSVPGTFSFDSIFWNHERAGDILTDANWSDDANDKGWKGTTLLQGVAGHGTSSPYDIHNTFIAAGPAIKQSLVSDVPTGNVDIAPTVLHVLGVKNAPKMDGRVIHEILQGGPDPKSLEVSRTTDTASNNVAAITYTGTLHRSTVDGHTYLDFTKVTREAR